MKFNWPSEVIEILSSSELSTLNCNSSPSGSVAVAVPIPVEFSATLKLASEVNTGALSLRLFIFTVMSCVAEFVPSDAVTVAL